MGFNQQFVFSYLVAEKWAGEWRPIDPAEQHSSRYDLNDLKKLLQK